ncbi:MAG: BatD family protein [Pirellulaceae bacterium]|nr:BatD family protein [Pirellulaceae bacterium]
MSPLRISQPIRRIENVGLYFREWCVVIASVFLLSIAASSACALQEIQLRATASAEEIFVGEIINYQVEILNSKSPSSPDLTAIEELFDVVELGNESRNQSQVTFINGRVTQSSTLSHVYQFRLTPKHTGDLKIPAATATLNGQVLNSNEIAVRVQPPEEQDVVLVEIKMDQNKIYPTQPFVVTLAIWVQSLPGKDARTDPLRLLRRNPPHININWIELPPGLSANKQAEWLQPILAQDGIGFGLNDISTRTGSIFGGTQAAAFDLLKGRETRDGLDGTPIEYFKYELTRTFTAEKSETYTFGPAVVKGTFVAGVVRSEYQPKRIIAIAPAQSVEVRDVPSPRPVSFCGGIGDYRWVSSASPTKLRVGDPLTLTLEVERDAFSGSLDLISAPDLSAIPEIMDSFDLIDKNPTGRIEGTTKRFSYAMRPKRSNVRLPAVPITTFDPRTEQFVDVTTNAIALEVSEANRVQSGDLVGSIPMTNSSEIKLRSEGIFQNISDLSQLQDERIDLSWLGWIVAGTWFAAGSLMILLTIYRRKTSDLKWTRRQQARRAAKRRFDEARQALKATDTKEALKHVRAALLGFFADTQDCVLEGLTTTDVSDILSNTSVSEIDQKAVVKLLESIESAEYGAGLTDDPSAMIDSAAILVARMAPILERGK